MERRTTTTITTVFAGLWAVTMNVPAYGEAPDAPALQVAQRTARADAHDKLVERIGRVRINATTIVKDFLDDDERIVPALGTRLREAEAFSRPRVYTDGTVEVDAQVSVRWLTGALQELHTHLYRGTRIKATDVAALTRDHTERFLIATGSSRIDRASDTHAERASSDSQMPVGWGNVTVAGMFMARRAAELDAYRRLTRQVERLRLRDTATVADVLAADERAEAELQAFVRKAALGAPQYAPERVCRVQAEIKVAALVATLKSLPRGREGDDGMHAADFNRIGQVVSGPRLSAVGRGVPPPAYVVAPDSATAGPALPAWAKRTLRATGTGSAPADPSAPAEARRRAGAFAFANAHRKLAEQLDAVQVAPTTTVSDLVETDDRVRADIATYLGGAHKIATAFATDGTATVTLELPLERLWHITRHHRPKSAP